jgi:hypothetical protein
VLFHVLDVLHHTATVIPHFPIMRRVAYYSVFMVHNSEEIGIRAAAARSSADWEGSEISEVSVAVAEFSETSNKV